MNAAATQADQTAAEDSKAPKSLRDYPQLITVAQFAQVAGITRATAYKLIKSGDLKAVHIRSAWRINRDSACSYLGL
ncbi:MAG: helix-turn-helix domain-containing protein [Olsenella sp.]|mgnify:FL=1|nr:helix-turn-helix domain-containing protein [Olsenella sp.]